MSVIPKPLLGRANEKGAEGWEHAQYDHALEAEINIAEILKNGWAGSRLEFKNGTKTNSQGFWEYAAKALKYATGDTGEPQDGQPKEWTARALYIWLRRKKDSWKFTKRVAAKWGLGEEQFQEAWKTTWESIRADNIIKGFKWRLLNKVLPTSDRLSRQGLVDAVRNCPLCGICRETVEHMFFHCREIKAAYAFWFVLANKLLLLLLLLFIGKPQQAFKASLQGARDIS